MHRNGASVFYCSTKAVSPFQKIPFTFTACVRKPCRKATVKVKAFFRKRLSRGAGGRARAKDGPLVSVSACLVSVLAHPIAVLACPNYETAVPARENS